MIKGILLARQLPTFDGELNPEDSTVIDTWTPSSHDGSANIHTISGTTFGDQVNHGGTEDIPAVGVYHNIAASEFFMVLDLDPTNATAVPYDLLSGQQAPTTPYAYVEVAFRIAVETSDEEDAMAAIGSMSFSSTSDLVEYDDTVLLDSDDWSEHYREGARGPVIAVDNDANGIVDYYYRDFRLMIRYLLTAGSDGFTAFLRFTGVDVSNDDDMSIYSPAYVESGESVELPYVIQS